MVKKKVSFDIDQKLLADIKALCQIKGMKLSDFFRDACQEKLKSDKAFLSIYVPLDGKIHHFQIDRSLYDIDLFEATHTMKVNVGAECEGVVRIFTDPNIEYDKEDRFFKLLREKEKLSFYTTKKFC